MAIASRNAASLATVTTLVRAIVKVAKLLDPPNALLTVIE
jgi:hypothetical protein